MPLDVPRNRLVVPSGFIHVILAAGLINIFSAHSLLTDLEKQLNKKIVLQIEPLFSEERYDVLPLFEKE